MFNDIQKERIKNDMKRKIRYIIGFCACFLMILFVKAPSVHAEVVSATVGVQPNAPSGAWTYMGDFLWCQVCYYTVNGQTSSSLNVWIRNTNPDYHYSGTVDGTSGDGYVAYDIDKGCGLTHRTTGRWDNPGSFTVIFRYTKAPHRGSHCGIGLCDDCHGRCNLPHNWYNSNDLASNATCTRPKYYYKKCSKCGAHGDVYPVGSALGHQNKWVVDTDLTCTQNMTGHFHCYNSAHNTAYDGPVNTANGSVLQFAPGHHFEELVNDTKATCTENGESHYVCTNKLLRIY